MTSIRRRLYLATFFTDMTSAAILFAVSRYLAERGLSLLVMGIIGGGVSVGWALGAFLGGAASDRLGRQPIILTGTVLILVSTLGCITFHGHIILLTLSYGLSGIANGIFYASVIAWLGEGESGVAAGRKRAKRTVLIFCLAWNAGLICGLFFGGLMFMINPVGPLVLAAGSCLINLVVVGTLKAPGRPHRVAIDPPVSDQEKVVSAAFARMCWIASFGGTACVGTIFHLFPALAVELEISSLTHGVLLALMRISVIASFTMMYFTSFWHYEFRWAVGARILTLIGVAILCLAVTALGILAGFVAIALAQGFNYFSNVCYSTSGSRQHDRGRTAGKMEAIISLGMATGTVLGGAVGVLHSRAPYVLVGVVVFVLAIAEAVLYFRHVAPLRRQLTTHA